MEKQEKLIQEEQEILNDLIEELDQVILKLDKSLNYERLKVKKSNEKCLPDTYGLLVDAQNRKKDLTERKTRTWQSRNELYGQRIIVQEYDESGWQGEEEEFKIGLHSYIYGGNVYIMSWLMPIARHYILNDSEEDFESVVKGSRKEEYRTLFRLKLKRDIELHFDKVTKVVHKYPILSQEEEKQITDEFLLNLLQRRSAQEFRNIVFSIQKKQAEIVKAPFKENIIVQGCAGSGKSMIMLHRLPIVLYDNVNTLDRSSIYTITPSLAYIQAADDMREDLEIDDLQMGTLQQYYDLLITRYGRKPEEYGKMPFLKISSGLEKYVYSEQCIEDIKQELQYLKDEKFVDYAEFIEKFHLKPRKLESDSIKNKISLEILSLQDIITKNDSVLKGYYDLFSNALEKLVQLERILNVRKIVINSKLKNLILFEEKEIALAEKELKQMHPEQQKIAYDNRKRQIETSQKQILDLKETQEIVELDDEYFEKLKVKATQINDFLKQFKIITQQYHVIDIKTLYQEITKQIDICNFYETIKVEIMELGDPYAEYVENLNVFLNTMDSNINALKLLKEFYLEYECYEKLKQTRKEYDVLSKKIVDQVYDTFMNKLGSTKDAHGNRRALNCSPYLYLQILYAYQGLPNAQREKLITIDEAQNVAVTEFKLIHNINKKEVIFNLFGDIKQHVENSKGINNWSEIQDIAHFHPYELEENYRNAEQVTKYCNRYLKLNMRAINLPGKGVHELETYEDFEKSVKDIFFKTKEKGLSCIIVKDHSEAQLIKSFIQQNDKINDITEEPLDVHRSKWNIMTVEQVKGLEFTQVFAVSGHMSSNEKYIAYTRALDELYVYDKELQIDSVSIEPLSSIVKEKNVQEESTAPRQKREKRQKNTKTTSTSMNVKEFFESHGLEVIDLRAENGFLWVIGSKEEIGKIVDKAMEQYGVTGRYGSGNATRFRWGWYTKTKK